jgi:hypothetical protein
MTIAQIKTLIIARINGGSNTVAKERELWNIILNESVKLFEIKDIDVNLTLYPTYLTDNFDATGLGKNDMLGFAICNGNNTTYDYSGLCTIGYGSGYTTLGAVGGSKDAVVVSHTHTYKQYSTDQEVSTNGNGVLALNKNLIQSGTFTTEATGVSGSGKNMQPYRVVLKIQRIA